MNHRTGIESRVWTSLAAALLAGIGFGSTRAGGAAGADGAVQEAPVAKTAAPEEELATVAEKTIAVGGVEVFLREWRGGGPPAVLLLHGAAFHSGTWKDLKTLEHLQREKIPFVAVDLPGYGKTPKSKTSADAFLAELIAALGIAPCVVVSPSMSGGFSFPALKNHPELFAGFVPVAPVRTAEFAPLLKECKVPTLVFWGEQDTVFAPTQADLLVQAMPNAHKVVLAGAKHPCYLDQPEEFHRQLVAFVQSVRPR